MIPSRSFRFLIWFCVYWTLIVAETEIRKKILNRTVNIPVPTCPSDNEMRSDPPDCDKRTTCLTPECRTAVEDIWNNMDYDVRPCDNFYKFTCGGFQNSAIIPNGKAFVNATTINTTFMANTILEQLGTILKKESFPNEPRSYKLAKDFYNACMTGCARIHLDELLDIISELGGWPVIKGDYWKESDFNFTDFIQKSRKLGLSINYFIKFEAIDNYNIYRRNQGLYLVPPTLGFHHEYLQGDNNEYVQEYYRYVKDIAVILGADQHLARLQLLESLDFERELAKIVNEEEMDSAVMVDEMSTRFPSIPVTSWKEFLNTLFKPQHQFDQHDFIVVKPSYLNKLGELLTKTPKKVQANYAFMRVVDELADFTFFQFRKLRLHRQSRLERCVRLVSDHLDFSIGSMYFNKDVRQTVLKMVDNIKAVFNEILREIDWMDNKTRGKAISKLNNLISYIVYPEELSNITNLDNFYKNLTLNADNPLGNKLNMTKFETNRLFDTLNKNEWWRSFLKPMKFHLFNQLNKNSIIISGAYMQNIFNSKRPNYMNYGVIGSMIGHEIIRGFNEEGRHYKRGRNVEWWQPQTLQEYGNNVNCMIQHYSKYRDEEIGMDLDGVKTLNQNVAENGGVKLAYYAYKKWVKQNGPEKKLPGISYTPEQLFWISYANMLCDKYQPEAMRELMSNGVQTPAEFRVNGA